MSTPDPNTFQRAAWAQLQHVAATRRDVARRHLKGLLEALVFASVEPLPIRSLSRWAKAPRHEVEGLLRELQVEYRDRGVRLEEIGGGFCFRTAPAFGPFVRELVAKKPARMSRALLETLAIISYPQPITRPEIDDIRGVDSGPVLRTLLDRDLVRILGKKEEPGRPLLYSTTDKFLQLFGLTGLSGLPTLREFTELTEDSRHAYEMEMGDEAPFNPLAMGMGGEADGEPPEEDQPNGDADEEGASLVEGARPAENETYARGSIDPSSRDADPDEGDEDGADRREDDELEGDAELDEDEDEDDEDEDDEDEDDDEDDEDDEDDDEQDEPSGRG